MSRMLTLLNAAADTLDDGSDPFGQTFLADNEVTLDECMALSSMLALGARIVAAGIENPTVMAGAVNGAGVAAAYRQLNADLDKLGRTKS